MAQVNDSVAVVTSTAAGSTLVATHKPTGLSTEYQAFIPADVYGNLNGSIPTYVVVATGMAAGASKNYFAMVSTSGSGKVIEVMHIRISTQTTAGITGLNRRVNAFRITNLSGGTTVTAEKLDNSNAGTPTQFNISVNGPTVTATGNPYAVGTVVEEETGGNGFMDLYKWNYGEQPWTISTGQGFAVGQDGTAMLGLISVMVRFRVR